MNSRINHKVVDDISNIKYSKTFYLREGIRIDLSLLVI